MAEPDIDPRPKLQLPYNGWRPRPDQMPLWSYLENGGKRAIELAHRRWGKDEIALHRTACAVNERPGNYWHMLPEASQARKAIWDAINPRTGIKRIDEAFPVELRARTINNEMKIEFKCGGFWQVLGSDNYNSFVGSPPVGVVFSEWALANPLAWSYVRPILAENGGWAVFITTVRGENHATRMYDEALGDPEWFAETKSADQTPVFSPEVLERERREYIREMGEDDGDALFRQEYYCDRYAPLVGSYYAKFITGIEANGQICDIPYDRTKPVYTAQDIGRTDDFVVWFYQKYHMRIHVIDCHISTGDDVPSAAKMLQDKGYIYGAGSQDRPHYVPWDAVPETFAAPRSVIQQYEGLGVRTQVVPNLSVTDQIASARAILPRCWFDKTKCAKGLEALRHFQREWDKDRKCFKDTFLHNWASHPAAAFQYLAVAYREENPSAFKEPVFRPPTLNEIWERQGRPREIRIGG